MQLVYVWIDEYNNIKNQGFNLGGEYNYNSLYDEHLPKLTITRNIDDNYIQDFFSTNENSNIQNISVIVGENGTGKTNLLRRIIDNSFIGGKDNLVLLFEENGEVYIEHIKSNYYSKLSVIFKGAKYKVRKTNGNQLSKRNIFQNRLHTVFIDNKKLEIKSDFQFSDWLTSNNTEEISSYIFLQENKWKLFDNKESTFIRAFEPLILFLKKHYETNKSSTNLFWNLIENVKVFELSFIGVEPHSSFAGDALLISNELSKLFKNKKNRGKFLIGDDGYAVIQFVHFLLGGIEFVVGKDEIIKSCKSNEIDFVIEKIVNNNFPVIKEEILHVYYNYFKKTKGFPPIVSLKFGIEIANEFEKLKNKFRLLENFNLKRVDISYSYYINKASFGESILFKLLITLYELVLQLSTTKKSNKTEFVLLLLDEPDIGFHYKWQRNLVLELISLIESLIEFYIDKDFRINIQIIITTHSPITVSDFPQRNIVYLSRNLETSLGEVLPKEKKPRHSFAANIHEIMTDSFYLDDGTMGNFAKMKIQKVIDWCNNKKTIQGNEEILKTINIIDEPIIRAKLREMYFEKVGKLKDGDFEIESINAEITRLEQLKNKIKRKIND